jgi:hypothetical protein
MRHPDRRGGRGEDESVQIGETLQCKGDRVRIGLRCCSD